MLLDRENLQLQYTKTFLNLISLQLTKLLSIQQSFFSFMYNSDPQLVDSWWWGDIFGDRGHFCWVLKKIENKNERKKNKKKKHDTLTNEYNIRNVLGDFCGNDVVIFVGDLSSSPISAAPSIFFLVYFLLVVSMAVAWGNETKWRRIVDGRPSDEGETISIKYSIYPNPAVGRDKTQTQHWAK